MVPGVDDVMFTVSVKYEVVSNDTNGHQLVKKQGGPPKIPGKHNKIYTILGKSGSDGGVVYNVTHVDFLNMNNSDTKINRYALEGRTRQENPDSVKILDGKKVTLEDFIEMMDGYDDLNKHMRVIKQLKNLDKMVSWIYDNANIIAAVNVILVLFILGVVIKGNYWIH
jgi:hypothetical protein